MAGAKGHGSHPSIVSGRRITTDTHPVTLLRMLTCIKDSTAAPTKPNHPIQTTMTIDKLVEETKLETTLQREGNFLRTYSDPMS